MQYQAGKIWKCIDRKCIIKMGLVPKNVQRCNND